MAGRGLGSLTLDLILKMGGFTGPLDKAGRDLAAKTKAMEARSAAFARGMNRTFGGLALKLGASVGGFFAVSKAVDSFTSSIDRADKMRDFSIQLGFGVENLSALSYAASQTGVDIDTLQTSLLRLSKNAAAALDPKSKQAGLFDALLGKGKAELKDTEKLLLQLADAFKTLGDSPNVAALEMELFGKSGAKMAEFLRQGSDGLKTLTDRAAELGVTIDQNTADSADRFNDKLGDLKAVTQGLGTQIATALLPQLEELLDWGVQYGSDPGNVEGLVRDTTAAFEDFATAVTSVVSTGSQIFGFLDGVKDKLNGMEDAGQRAALAVYRALSPDGSTFDRMLDENEARLGLAPRDTSGAGRGHNPIRRPTQRKTASGPTPEVQALRDRIAALLADRSTGGGGGKGGLSEAEKAAKQLEEAYQRMNGQMAETIALFGQTSEAVKVRYELEHGELAGLSQAKKDQLIQQAQMLDTLKAEEELLRERNKALEEEQEIRARAKESVAALLSDMQFELDLLGKTNAARVAEIELRRIGIGLTPQEVADAKARIEAKALEFEATQKQIAAMDQFRASFEDNLTDVLTGAKSIGDAIKDMADAFVAQIARMIAQKWTEQLFGAMGSSSTGSAGGGIADIFGMFLGGARAAGGPVSAGVPYLVGERGPEIVVPRAAGNVIPNHKLGSSGAGNVINITVAGNTTRETAQQIANKVGQTLAFAGRGS